MKKRGTAMAHCSKWKRWMRIRRCYQRQKEITMVSINRIKNGGKDKPKNELRRIIATLLNSNPYEKHPTIL
jgi:hypothetical protein